MIICTKAEVIGGYFVKNPIPFTLNDVSITLSSSNEKNYVEAARQVTDYQQIIGSGFDEICQYAGKEESVLLDSLKIVESLGSFLIRIQEIKYDERETYWVAETDEDRAIIDKLPKSKWSLDKDNSIIEVSEIVSEKLSPLCSSTNSEVLYAFEFLRQGSVSFRNGNFYFAFINYFMLLEEAFGNGRFKSNEIESNFLKSKILYLCVLTALDLLYRDQLDKLYVDWMQTEVNKHSREWNYEGVIHTIIRFRGDYLHSHRRTQILRQRDQFFKYIAAFTQRICIAYCCYLIKTSDIEHDEMNRYVDDEIERLKGLLAK
jgi:hypothetical protein